MDLPLDQVNEAPTRLSESELNALLLSAGEVLDHAARRAGGGAYLNGMRLRLPDVHRIADAVVGITDFAVADDRLVENPMHISLLARLAPQALAVRTHGSAALDLAWLAAGRLGASMMLSNRAWDVSAGVLLARESGGLVYDCDGSEHGVDSRFTIASAPSLKHALLEMLPDT